MPRPAPRAIQLVHYNDVYNIDASRREPVGGAARFITAIRQAVTSYPGPSLVLFSGDAFSPAPLTVLTAGSEIPPVLNATSVDVACIGNHELDGGIDVMKARIAETNFPWLCSNVKEKATGLPIGAVHEYFILERANVRFGFMALASSDWLSTLDKVNWEDIEFEEYVEAADRLSTMLRDEVNCDFVIALTHMRQPDDDRLARHARDIDIILGGHDHVLCKKFISGRYVVKSGTDFKNFSTIKLDVDTNWALCAQEPVHHDVTSDIPEDPIFSDYVREKLDLLGPEYKQLLAVSTVDLDGRFLSIRTQETGLGNFMTDVLASYMDTNIALINAGSFRSDCIDRPGKITQQTITSILPFQEKAVVVAYTGLELLAILENAVSQYPLLDGRFLQASGISFKFDPRLSAGKRIHPSDVFCRQVDNSMKQIEEDAVYQVAVKTFLFDGMDGYPKGCPSKVIHRSDTTISSMVSRYLKIANPAEAANMPTISPRCEGRIVCVHPDEDVLHAYKYPKD